MAVGGRDVRRVQRWRSRRSHRTQALAVSADVGRRDVDEPASWSAGCRPGFHAGLRCYLYLSAGTSDQAAVVFTGPFRVAAYRTFLSPSKSTHTAVVDYDHDDAGKP